MLSSSTFAEFLECVDLCILPNWGKFLLFMFFCTLFLIFLDSGGTNTRLCVLSFLHKPMFIFVFNRFPLCYSDWRIYIALCLSSPFCPWMNLVKFVCLFLQFFFLLCCSDLNFPSDLIYAFCFFAETYYLSIPFKRVYPHFLHHFYNCFNIFVWQLYHLCYLSVGEIRLIILALVSCFVFCFSLVFVC